MSIPLTAFFRNLKKASRLPSLKICQTLSSVPLTRRHRRQWSRSSRKSWLFSAGWRRTPPAHHRASDPTLRTRRGDMVYRTTGFAWYCAPARKGLSYLDSRVFAATWRWSALRQTSHVFLRATTIGVGRAALFLLSVSLVWKYVTRQSANGV